jgi:hypothetical protein
MNHVANRRALPGLAYIQVDDVVSTTPQPC